ncbi:MAG: 50S ribosomal protein L11 methyltransferase [Candidatus Auribacter fodinae]|jgi:ribosomal protein L11 methyltransferase|uniref:Ribosomal protein L11 methyltransferase n=1 Tax=Candidatus Auribacter fodinae TaxID=2093366 RepID=A0A3A4R8B9_9BACT|nr:MAG: 50S ribosomal protein L11 methyltransferase [Candidatus Auribacter fodinae]
MEDQYLYTITITTHMQYETPLEVFFEGYPSSGIVFQIDCDHPDKIICSVYFDTEPDIAHIRLALKQLFEELEADGLPEGGFELTSSISGRNEWLESWKVHFKTMKIGKRLVVTPSWENYKKSKPDEIVITCDPGMAFGTGQHPTTRFCLEVLDEYVRSGCSVLDMGCGSGILAVAASALGAGDVYGFDNDPVAIEFAEELSRTNNTAAGVHFYLSDLDQFKPERKYDIVVANLFAELLVQYKDTIIQLLHKDSILALTGILYTRMEMVSREFTDCGLTVIRAYQENEWRGLLLKP